jgi:hypothetical protein
MIIIITTSSIRHRIMIIIILVHYVAAFARPIGKTKVPTLDVYFLTQTIILTWNRMSMLTFTERAEQAALSAVAFVSFFTNTTKRVCCKWWNEKR